MPNKFTVADAKASAAVDFIYGEQLQRIPWSVGGGYTTHGEPDPSRLVINFLGTITGALSTQDTGGDRRGGDFRGELTTRDRTVTADMLRWPADTKQGDRIRAMDMEGQPLFEIVGEPHSDGINRMIANLVTAK